MSNVPAWRRIFTAILLAAMMSPLLINAAVSKPASHPAMAGHEMSGDNAGHAHAKVTGHAHGKVIGHKHMVCSVFVPCDHGFCVGMFVLATGEAAPIFLTRRFREIATSMVAVSYAPIAPPPKHSS